MFRDKYLERIYMGKRDLRDRRNGINHTRSGDIKSHKAVETVCVSMKANLANIYNLCASQDKSKGWKLKQSAYKTLYLNKFHETSEVYRIILLFLFPYFYLTVYAKFSSLIILFE